MQNDGKGSGVGDGAKMRFDARLHRLVVVGHDRHDCIRTRSLCEPGQLDGPDGVIRPGSSDHPDRAPRGLDGGTDELVALSWCQRGGLAGRLTDHEGGHMRFDLPLAKSGECREVECALLIEWSGRSGM